MRSWIVSRVAASSGGKPAISTWKQSSISAECTCRMTTLFIGCDDLLDSAHLTIQQTDFDAMWVMRRFGENIFDNAFGQFACALILFQNDQHGHTGFNV